MGSAVNSSSLIEEFQRTVELHRHAYAQMPCTRENIHDALVALRCKLEEIEAAIGGRITDATDARCHAWEYMLQMARISITELSQIAEGPRSIDQREVAEPLAILESVKICTLNIMPLG